jgi:hypothetical protein
MRKHQIIISLLLFLSVVRGYSQSESFKAQSLFIYNFIKYSSWPVSDGPFTIIVFGSSPITHELLKLAALKKTPDGKNIIVKEVSSLEQITNCQILYIPDDKSKDVTAISQFTKDKPVLIIGERDGLARKGAAIAFFTQDDDRLSFELNRKNLQARSIKVSGELMRLAELVE